MTVYNALLTLLLYAVSFVALAQDDSKKPDDEGEVAQQQAMQHVRDLIDASKAAEAIPTLDRMLDYYAGKFPEGNTRWYVARTPEETLAYLAEAAAAYDRGTGTGDEAVSLYVLWAEAHYMKGYALVELGRMAAAKPSLERAIHLSPYNARFLAELGNLYQWERNWEKAYELYLSAEDLAAFSPPQDEVRDRGRAKRGLAFVLVEQGKFEEARKKLEECLELDQEDQRARNELDYIRSLEDAKSNSSV